LAQAILAQATARCVQLPCVSVFPTLLTMTMDAAGLLATAHGECLRMVCDAMHADFNGLTVAARHARRDQLIDVKMLKTLTQLDIAFAYVRHITLPKDDALLTKLRHMLLDPGAIPAPATETEASETKYDCSVDGMPDPDNVDHATGSIKGKVVEEPGVTTQTHQLHRHELTAGPDLDDTAPSTFKSPRARHVHFSDVVITHAAAVAEENAHVPYTLPRRLEAEITEKHIEQMTSKFYSSSALKNSVQKMLGQLDQACNKLAQIAAGHQGSTAEVARAKEILAIMDALLAKARGTKDLKLQLETMDEIQKKLGECEDF